VVNPHVSEVQETEIKIRGASLKSGVATTLSHSDIHAHNTFDQKQVVAPQTRSVAAEGPSLNYVFPAASVTKLALTLS
jgi:alpha-L-arabinofuranosidase